MIRRRWLAVLSCAILCIAGPAQGQSSLLLDPFRPPAMPLMCHELPPIVLDSMRYVFEFIDADSSAQRQTIVGYDSLGHPFGSAISIMEPAANGIMRKVTLTMRFGGKPWGKRRVYLNGKLDTTQVPAPASPSTGLPPGILPLTALELSRGASISSSLWDHRCGAGRTIPPESPSSS